MEFYSPDKELKETFGWEIKDAEYIAEVNEICDNVDISYEEARFKPHNLLTNWNECVERELFGDEDTDTFYIDFRRQILFELENHNRLKRHNDHRIFLEILKSIDKKFQSKTFIPIELKKEKEWWKCSVFKKGTPEYIKNTEKDLYYKYNVRLNLEDRIEQI